ncbi:hypothetical protein G3O06_05435 [Burkholderia sp. Ac-20345]|uniref:hypothetical protein n=1 Tax=Burkholderia sp. Ac-20345 TaxID=2703891 RepID=UPI00197C0B4E|nr:hypothetical protein [Burkholderia sp. Ac-20345]MBN3777012.1 hypothetical protein [Burkholderia sp. Ac-20345]
MTNQQSFSKISAQPQSPVLDHLEWLAGLKEGDRVEVPYSLATEDIKRMTVVKNDRAWIRLLPDGYEDTAENTVLVDAVSGFVRYGGVRIVPLGTTVPLDDRASVKLLEPGKKYVFFNESDSCITTWCAEGRVDSPVTHYLESGFQPTHWCEIPSESDARWREGNPWDDADAQDVGVLTLSRFYPSGRLTVSWERKRPDSRADVNHPVFAGAHAWMLVDELRGSVFQVPDVLRKPSGEAFIGRVQNVLSIHGWEKADGTAIARKNFATAVCIKEALVYLADFAGENYMLQGSYYSEGRNQLEGHSALVPKASDPEAAAAIVRKFAENADRVVGETYAARLARPRQLSNSIDSDGPAEAGQVRNEPDALTIAYLAIGARDVLREMRGQGLDVDLDSFRGETGFIDDVVGHALFADRASDWFDANDGHPGVFVYEVAEPFGDSLARSMIANGETVLEPGPILRDILAKAGYESTSTEKALENAYKGKDLVQASHVLAVSEADLKRSSPTGKTTGVRKSVIQFTVLHDDGKDLSSMSVEEIGYECREGAYVGGGLSVVSSGVLTRELLDTEAAKIGADPTFFEIDSADDERSPSR